MKVDYTFKGKDRKPVVFTLDDERLPRPAKNWDRASTGGLMYRDAVKKYKKAEEIEQPYTVSDVITNLLHFAAAAGFDAEDVLQDAEKHWRAECEGDGFDPDEDPEDENTVEVCPKCGSHVARKAAFEDEGEGEEAGRTFYYCSEHCRATH